MTGVLIAALSPAMRAGLRALLTEADISVVGEIVTLEGLAYEASPFDVLLVADEELLRDIAPALPRAEREALAVVLMTDSEHALAALRALPLRGWSIQPLDATAAELHAAIIAAAQGLAALPISLADRLLEPRRYPDTDTLLEPLTAREREVLTLLAQGLPNKLIARHLEISEHTVKFHLSAIFSKLGASSRTDAVSRGARQGLIAL